MKSIAQLEEIRWETLDRLIIRKGQKSDPESPVKHIMVCAGTGCTSSNSEEIISLRRRV